MLGRYFQAAVMLILVSAAGTSIARAEQECDRPCRNHPQLVAPCFTVRGRMNFANGAPSVRIWRVGTKRILGVSEAKYYDPKYCNLPAEILAKLSWKTDLFGDFTLCPFERSQTRSDATGLRGWRQEPCDPPENHKMIWLINSSGSGDDMPEGTLASIKREAALPRGKLS